MQEQILSTSYDTWLVAGSFVLSALGAGAALSAAELVRDGGVRPWRSNVVMAGLALGGVGIWGMHFLGMLALHAGAALGYRWFETIASLVVAVVVSAMALGYLAAAPFTWRRLLVAGPLTGLGVATMHFLGMSSLRFAGFLAWNPGLVALSVAIAVVAATAALWLAFHVRGPAARVAGALAMAGAVCAMHYVGMSAATLVCSGPAATQPSALPEDLLSGQGLGALVFFVAVAAAGVVILDGLIQRTAARDDPWAELRAPL